MVPNLRYLNYLSNLLKKQGLLKTQLPDIANLFFPCTSGIFPPTTETRAGEYYQTT